MNNGYIKEQEGLLEKARELCYYLENSYWQRDDMVDIETEKSDRYWALFAEYWFNRIFFEKLLKFFHDCEKVSLLLKKIKNSELKLWGLAIEEAKVRRIMHTSPREAIIILQNSRGYHSQIYIDIFNYFFDTNHFNNYRAYRELELLSKDFDNRDIEEDFQNANLSAAIILYENMKKGYLSKKNAILIIENIGKVILRKINKKDIYFHEKGKKIIEEIPVKVSSFLKTKSSF